MAAFDIFVDSAANLTDEMVKNTGIKVIPFNYIVDGVEHKCYEQGRPFGELAKSFYELLEGGEVVKTSLVCEQQYIDELTPTLEAGRDVLLITMTATLSGTHAQAVKAAETLAETFPERKIVVVDSANASLGEGLLAVRAAELRDEGKDVTECGDWVEENKYFMNSYVTVNDLKYLKRSGRVSTIAAVAGALLNIKPMLKANGAVPAVLAVYAKERGRRKSIDALIRGFKENVIDPAGQTIAITHGNCLEEAEALKNELIALGADKVEIEYYDLCTGSHVGPGTIALFFMGKDRRSPEEVAQHRKLLFMRKKAQN